MVLIGLKVALRKESVDRNQWIKAQYPGCRLSLSARRAWIEILSPRLADMSAASLSARRAWIEIANFCRNRFCPTSLSARRAWIEITQCKL